MRIKLLLLAIALICMNKLTAKKLPGYYITASNDTVKVIFRIPVKFFSQLNYERLQRKVKYYDSKNQKHTLRPGMAEKISFEYEGETIQMLSRKNNLEFAGALFSDGTMFLHLIKDGKMKLFKYYRTQHSSGMYNGATGMTTGGYSYPVEKYVMQKSDGELFKVRWLFFKKDMEDYLSDCPALAKKVAEKIYRSDDIEQIITEYNETCK